MNPGKNSRLLVGVLTAVILLGAASLGCNLVKAGKATPPPPTFTPLPLTPTLPSPTPTVPLPTPTQAVRELAVQNGTVTLTIKSQKKEIRFEPPDEGDISGLQGAVYSLSGASLVMVSDSAGGYLSEYRFVTETDPATVSVVLKPAKYSPYSQYNVHAVNVGDLLTERKSEAPLASLHSALASLKMPADFGLIVAQPDSVSDAQSMAIYGTHLPGVLVALPADMQKQADVKSAMVLSVREVSRLSAMGDMLKAQTQKISIADLTGLSLRDLADLQIHEASKLAKPDEDIGYFGNTKYEVKYNQKQIKEFTYYVKNVVVIDMPCGAPDMKDRIFSMEPAAGSEVVPRDARITLYRCEAVSQEPLAVVSLPFAPPAEPCQLKPASGLLEVALVIDISGSMYGTGLASAKAAAITFLKKLGRENSRVGLAVFESKAKVLSQLTDDFDSVTGLISGLAATGGTAIDAGLVAGQSILEASQPADATKVILLLSDGGSAAGPALQAAAQIKAAGATILTVGVGGANQSLLAGLASSSAEFVYSETSQGLEETFAAQALRLQYGGQTVARNAVMRFKVNAEKYVLLDNLLDHGGRAVSHDTVEWFVSQVFPTQVITVPVVLRPLEAAPDQAFGTLEVTYDQCTDGPSVSAPPQAITQAFAQRAAGNRQVIEYEQPKTGTLEEFRAASYLLDPNTPGVFSVVIAGAGSELAPEIYARNGKEKLMPLYTVRSDDKKKRISTFYLKEPRLYWLTLQSNSLDDQGEYSATVQRGEVIDPPPLDPGGAGKTNESVELNDTRVYNLQGVKEGDYLSVVATRLYPDLISMDGQYNSELFYVSKGAALTVVYLVRGKGPYRLTMTNTSSERTVQYDIAASLGDKVSQAMGALEPGATAKAKLGGETVHIWRFEGKKGQGIDLELALQPPQKNTYAYYYLFNPDGTSLASGSLLDTGRLGWTQVDQDGSYLLVMLRPYGGGSAFDYTLDLSAQPLPEATLVEVKSGDKLQGTVVNRRLNNYLVKIEPGQVLTVNVSLVPTTTTASLQVIDPLGQASLTAQSYSGQLALGPVTIRYAGEYTLRLYTNARNDATYELSVELK